MSNKGRWSDVAMRILAARSLRGLVDGLVSVLLAEYLGHLGFTAFEIGAIVTGTLLGSALLTILVGMVAHRFPVRSVLLGACVLMSLTGVGFATASGFWLILAIAVVGTMNPSGGDVSVFLPMEQAVLAQTVTGASRASLFAWYNLGGAGAAGLGALLVVVPSMAAKLAGEPVEYGERGAFLVYALFGVLIAWLYWHLPSSSTGTNAASARPLAHSRRTVLQLAALFSLDSFGGGFAVQSLLVLWLQQRFGLSIVTAGQVFFATGLMSALSQLVSARLVGRIGHVRTMVYTHLPANLFLILAGVAPTAGMAVTFLVLRAALSQMDVPARQAFVMSIVPPEERAAAASITNVPRSLASALAPLLAGLLLEHSSFGWPLICGGVCKAVYDVLLLVMFGRHDADLRSQV